MRFPDLREWDRIAYDTETTGLRYKIDTVFGFSVAMPGAGSIYYDIRQTPKAVDWFNDQMAQYQGIVICHNASFDARMSAHTGIHIPLHLLDDTMIRACLIDEHLPAYDLDSLLKKYLGQAKETDIWHELAMIFGGSPTRKAQIQHLHKADPELVAKYANQDTSGTLDLWDWQEEEIFRQDQPPVPLQRIMEFERSLMPVVISNEMHGIRVDEAAAERAMDDLTPLIQETQAKLDDINGGPFNANSSPQVRNLLAPEWDGHQFNVGGIPVGTTNKGQPSLSAGHLRELDHPGARLILEIRSLIKTRDTFLGGHILGHAICGRVYPNINQTKGEDGGTGTGRFSYVRPALQQIPSRNKRVASIVKPIFLPDEGQIWLDADQNSFEVRVFAHLINIPSIIETYIREPTTDFHQYVADITNLVRNAEYSGQPNAKQLNLSMIFNSGNGAIAEAMGMPWKWETFTPKDEKKEVTYKKAGVEAMEVINKYHRRLPGVKKLAEGCKKKAIDRGYIRTAYGRRIRFPGWMKRLAYKASGLLIQSTSADFNKQNWLLINEALGDRGRLVLNTHDSYGMSVPEDTWRECWKDVKHSIESSDRSRVPLLLDLNGTGQNWWEAINND